MATMLNFDPCDVTEYDRERRGMVSRLRAVVAFGILDTKGRALGCRAYIEEYRDMPERREDHCVWSARTGGFYTSIQATRDGEAFGATTTTSMRHDTLDEAKASLAKRVEQSRKRQAKQFPEGVK